METKYSYKFAPRADVELSDALKYIDEEDCMAVRQLRIYIKEKDLSQKRKY